jgi:hypothetical protein
MRLIYCNGKGFVPGLKDPQNGGWRTLNCSGKTQEAGLKDQRYMEECRHTKNTGKSACATVAA